MNQNIFDSLKGPGHKSHPFVNQTTKVMRFVFDSLKKKKERKRVHKSINLLVVIVLQNMPFSKSFEMQIWFKYDSAEWEKLA